MKKCFFIVLSLVLCSCSKEKTGNHPENYYQGVGTDIISTLYEEPGDTIGRELLNPDVPLLFLQDNSERYALPDESGNISRSFINNQTLHIVYPRDSRFSGGSFRILSAPGSPPVSTWQGPYYTKLSQSGIGDNVKLIVNDGMPWYPNQIFFCNIYKYEKNIQFPSSGGLVYLEITGVENQGFATYSPQRRGINAIQRATPSGNEYYINFYTLIPQYNVIGQEVTHIELPSNGSDVEVKYWVMVF